MANIFQRIRVTRNMRLKEYLDRLSADISVKDKADKRRISVLEKKITGVFTKMRVLSGMRIFFYFLLYVSVVSNFLGDLAGPGGTVLGRFAQPFIILSSILGTTISLLLILLLTKFINTYWEDARTYATHLIAIYAKNEKPGSRIETFFESENGN